MTMSKHVYNVCRDKEDSRDYIVHTEEMFLNRAVSLPSDFDLIDKCPSVFDQGLQGSCSANAGVAARIMLTGDKTLDLSRSFLYYQERVLEGTTDKDSGATIRDIVQSVKQFGICKEQFMPYDENTFNVAPSEEAMKNAEAYKINAYRRLPAETSGINALKQWLITVKQPIVFGFTVFSSFESEKVAETGIVPMPSKGEEILGGHAVIIVGWEDNPNPTCFLKKIFKKTPDPDGYFIVQNSYGENWGIKGRFKMPYSFVTQGISYDYWIMEM